MLKPVPSFSKRNKLASSRARKLASFGMLWYESYALHQTGSNAAMVSGASRERPNAAATVCPSRTMDTTRDRSPAAPTVRSGARPNASKREGDVLVQPRGYPRGAGDFVKMGRH